MWFQVELPEAVNVTEVQFDAAGGGRLGGGGGNRGRGGRGAPPAATGTTVARRSRLDAVRLAAPPPAIGYARRFRVDVSVDGTSWLPVAEGSGAPLTTAAFRPTRAKVVRITQTADAPGEPPWVVQNLRLFRR